MVGSNGMGMGGGDIVVQLQVSRYQHRKGGMKVMLGNGLILQLKDYD